MTATKTELVLAYIGAHPWSMNTQIATATRMSANDVAAITTYYFKGMKDPRLIRIPADTGAAARPAFAYALVGTPYPAWYVPEPQAARAAAPTPAPTLPPSAAPAAPTQAATTINLEALAEQISDSLVTLVAAKLAEKLTNYINAAFEKKIPMTPDEFVASLLVPKSAPPPVKPTVLIVGLLPQQAGFIQTEYGHLLDLRFWKEGNMSKLRSMVQNAEFVFTFTSKIGHDAESMIRSQNKDPIRITGGMTTLREKLSELFVHG